MSLTIEQKKSIVQETHETAAGSISAIVADYRGMSVTEITDLRKQARENDVKLVVVRNTLAKLAFDGTDHDCLSESLVGPSLLAFSKDDPGSGARLFREILKSPTALEVKAISVGGTLCDSEDLARVAEMPTKEQAISQLMSVMLGPVSKFTQILYGIPSKLVRTLDALREQKAADE